MGQLPNEYPKSCYCLPLVPGTVGVMNCGDCGRRLVVSKDRVSFELCPCRDCEACRGNVAAGKSGYACGLKGPAGQGLLPAPAPAGGG